MNFKKRYTWLSFMVAGACLLCVVASRADQAQFTQKADREIVANLSADSRDAEQKNVHIHFMRVHHEVSAEMCNILEAMRPARLKLLQDLKNISPREYTHVSIGSTIQLRDYDKQIQAVDLQYGLLKDLTYDELVSNVAWYEASKISLFYRKGLWFVGKELLKTFDRIVVSSWVWAHIVSSPNAAVCFSANMLYFSYKNAKHRRLLIQECDRYSFDLGGVVAAQGMVSQQTKFFFEMYSACYGLLFGKFDHVVMEQLIPLPFPVNRIALCMEYYFKTYREAHKDAPVDHVRDATLKWVSHLVAESCGALRVRKVSVEKLHADAVDAQIEPIQKQLISELEKAAANLK